MQFKILLKRGLYVALLLVSSISLVKAQPGQIIETGDQVLDPNQDGFTSLTNTGFNQDGYDVDEFEYKMFGIPIFGDGEALNDVQSGQPCGVVDIALDTAGFGIYAGFDSNENLIFRFRLAGDQQSVQSYSIFMDTDQLVGSADPNSSAINPGFEIEITLIQRFGVYIYDVDGAESCPTPLRAYDVDTHQQKSITGSQSCDDEDVYMDFYVPFSDLEELFGITPDTNVRFAGVTNISATCALDGSISDIGGVDDVAYDGCFSCAILDLTENQCPSSVSNLCETCAGFPLGATETPTIELPVIVGDLNIAGSAEAESEIFVALFSSDAVLLDRDTINTDPNGNWQSSDFVGPLNFGDSVVVNALLPGKCESGALDTGLSFAIVSPNQPPVVSGPGTTITYVENDPPKLFGEEIVVTDDNSTLHGATIIISSNYEDDLDFLSLSPPDGLLASYDSQTAALTITGEANLATYQDAIRAITFHNSSEAPSLEIREVTYQVFDGTNYSPVYSSSIIVTEQNDSPVIIINNNPTDTIYVSTDEDVPLPFCVEAEDVDLDELAITSTTLAEGHGSIVVDEGLCLIFQPETNYNGSEYIEITICDDGDPALCDTVIAAIQINPVNDAPEIHEDEIAIDSLFFSIEQASDLSFCLSGYDLEDDALVVESVELISDNSSTLEWQSDLCFNYTPQTSFIGIDEAKITICDTGSPSRCTILYIEIDVEDINFPPEITSTSGDTLYVEMFKNTTSEICIDATDPDNDILDFGPLTDLLDVGGTSELTYSCLNYTPPENYVGIVLLDVSVCDDVTPAKCDQLVLKIDVLPFNNAPQVVIEDIPVDTVLFTTDMNVKVDLCLDVIDPDNDNVATTTIEKDSGEGSFEIDGDLCIIFTPDTDVVGEVWGTVTICDDGDPTKCIETIVGINITPVNDPPEIKFNGNEVDTLYYETLKNTEFEICIEAEDVNGDTLRVESIEEINSGGFYVPGETDLCLGFVPEAEFVGAALHQIIICDDGSPVGCDTVFVEVNVLNQNRAPKLLYNEVEVDTINVSTIEDIPIELCVNAQDEDGDQISLSELTLLSGEGSNTLTENASDYCLTYSPSLGFFGDAYVGLLVCDNGTPEQCAYVVIHIEVINQNSAPEVYQNGIVIDTIRFDTPARTSLAECIEALDKDGDELILTLPDQSVAFGEVSSSQNLCFGYTPDTEFLGSDYFDFTICDNQDPALCTTAVIEINVYSENSPPKILLEGNEITSADFDAVERNTIDLAFEIDDNNQNDTHQIADPTIVSGTGNLSTILEDGWVYMEYTPAILSNGDHQVSFTICDDGLPEMCTTVTLNISVEKEEVFPFEAISPNNDGMNDFWVIQGIEHYPNNKVRIFDRWNNLVFSLDSYDNETNIWNGVSNNGISKAELNDGTYYYKITLVPGHEALSGSVVLKR